MEIKKKYYPYPVLAEYTDDYKSGKFCTNAIVTRDGYKVHINYSFQLDEPMLQKLIEDGSAYAVFHLECAQTGYRKAVRTTNHDGIEVIDSEKLSGELQICSFIVAAKNISGYTNDNFHDDYAGLSFDIDEGCILAVGGQINSTIKKDMRDFSDIPSIFSIIRNADPAVTQMQVDYTSGEKIIVALPLNDYYSYKQLYKLPDSKDIVNAIVIVPTLTYVLSEIIKMDENDREEFISKSWYISLKNKLQNLFHIDIESNRSSIDPLVLAQQLINDPASKAFKILVEESD